MSRIFERQIQDSNFTKTKALPAAGANNNSPTFDLGAGGSGATGVDQAFRTTEEIVLQIDLPALSAHTDTTKNVTLKIQHSDDDSSYAALDDGVGSLADIVLVTPGVASTGTAARSVHVRLPTGVKRYVQINQAVTSGGPTLTASSVTYSLRF